MEYDLISIIIPVYNVEKYINACIRSVVQQTYNNLEIILIDDCSVDKSLLYCRYWEKMDRRIIVRLNEYQFGPGKTRDEGVRIAKGKYIVFLDSDDWMAVDFVEKMYKDMLKTDADFVASNEDFIVVDEKVVTIRHDIPEGVYDTEDLKKLVLLAGSTAMWGKLFQKEWLFRNKINQPETFWAEDYAIFPAMVLSAKKITVISNAGMYYRRLRKGSLTSEYNSIKLYNGYKRAIEVIETKMVEEFKESLAAYCLKGYYLNYDRILETNNVRVKEMMNALRKQLSYDFRKYGLKLDEKECILVGSFSLRWELQNAGLMQKHIPHFCLSSIVSMTSECPKIEVTHKNLFRKHQIEQDMEGRILKNISEKERNKTIFIDFLEERFDIIEIEKDRYITRSEALLETDWKEQMGMKIICSGTEEHMKLWEEKCIQFIQLIKEKYCNPHIVLVKNRMMSQYGNLNNVKEFPDKIKIKKINCMIERMEKFFASNIEKIKIIEGENKDFLFTDSKFQWGCRSEYANNVYYAKMGMKLFEILYT